MNNRARCIPPTSVEPKSPQPFWHNLRRMGARTRIAAACAATLLGSISTIEAAGVTHPLNVTGTSNWSADDWGINGVPNSGSTGDIASYINSLLATTTLDINANIGQLVNGGAGNWSIVSDGTHALTLDNTGGTTNPFGGTNAFIGTTGTGNLSVASAIILANTNLTIGNNTSDSATQGVITITGGITGTGNVYIADGANSASAINITTAAINNTGALVFGNSDAATNQTGTGAITVSGGVGPNVTSISDFAAGTVTVGAVTLGADMTITSGSNAVLTLNGGVTGAHNLVFNTNGTGQIQLSTSSVNNGGTIVNSGTGTGTTVISSVIGSNVTSVTQNSATSALSLSAANAFGQLTIHSGTVNAGSNSGALGAGSVSLGDPTVGGTTSASLLINGSANVTFANPISVVAGTSGTLSIGVSPTFSGTNGSLGFSGPITLNNNLSITGAVTGTVLTVSGAISGTGNITIGGTAGTVALSGGLTNIGNLTFSGSGTNLDNITTLANNTGSILVNGTSTNAVTFSAGIGTNVTGITQASNSSALNITTNAITLGADMALVSTGSAGFTVSGGITGSHNLVLNTNGSGNITISTTAVNNTGTITISGTGSGSTSISGSIASTVGNITLSGSGSTTATLGSGAINSTGTIINNGTTTGTSTISGVLGASIMGVVQNSTTSQLTLSGNNSAYTGGVTIKAGVASGITSGNAFGTGTITLGDTTLDSANATLLGGAGLTFANPIVLTSSATATGTLSIGGSGSSPAIFSGGISGTNNLNLASTASGGVTISTNAINITGAITNSGTGSGTTTISAPLGSNITAITQASATSALTISSTIPVGTLTSTGAAALTATAGFSTTGNLTFNANGSGSITISTTGLNNTGTITNSGTGTGGTTISAVIGANVTGVFESGTSPLTLSGLNLYTGSTTITSGTVILTANDGATGTGGNLGMVPTSFNASSVIINGGAIQAPTVALNLNRGIKIGPNGATVIATSGNFAPAGIISDLTGTPGLLTIAAGGGLWVPGGQNTYSGGTLLQSGGFTVPLVSTTGSPGALVSGPYGTGTLTLAGGQFRATSSTAITLGNNIILQGDITIPSGGQTLTLTGPITLTGGDRTLTTNATATTTISGAIGQSGGTRGFIKGGTGTMILTGAETYTGQTGVTGGNLTVNGGSLAGTAVNVSAGATFLVKGNYTIGTSGNGSVTVAGGPTTTGGILSLVDGTLNILTINNATAGATALTLGGTAGNAAQLSMDIGDQIILGNGLLASIGAGGVTLNLNTATPLTGTTQTIISAPGGGLTSGGSITLNTSTGNFNGYVLGLITTSTAVQLTETANATPSIAYFKGGIDKNWNTFNGGNANNSNWTSDAAGNTDTNALPGATTDVHFYAANATTTNLTTTLGQNISVKTLNVDGGTLSTAVSIAGGGGTLTIIPTDPTTGISVGSGAGAFTISAPIVLGANQTWTNAASNTMTASGGVTGSANLTLKITGSSGISISTTAINISGNITNSGTGTGTTTLTGVGANVSTITEASNTSPLTISTSGSLIVGANGKTLVSNGTALLQAQGGVTGTGNLVLNANSSGQIQLGTTSVNNFGTITNSGTGTGTTTIGATLGGNVTGVIENGTAPLTISGSNSSYVGTTTVIAGTLQASTTSTVNSLLALGTGGVVLNGGTLQLRANGSGSAGTIITGNGSTGNNVTVGGSTSISVDRSSANTGNVFQFNNLTLSGGNLAVTGADSYGLSFAGTTSLTANTTLSPATAPLTLAAVTIDNSVATGTTTTLTLDGTGTGTITGLLSNNSVDATKVLSLTKSNTGSWTITGTGSYTGGTLVTGGTLNIGSATTTGTIAGSSIVSVSGGTLALDYSAAINDRLGDTSTVNIGGGSLAMTQGSQASNVLEQIGTLAFNGGGGNITITATTGSMTLAASSLGRANNGVGLIRGSALGQSSSLGALVTLAAAPSTGPNFVGAGGAATGIGSTKNLAIVPWLLGDVTTTGTGIAFTTYDTVTGFRPLAAGEVDTTLAGAATGDNVQSSGSETLAGGLTINSLFLTPTATQAITGAAGNRLVISSGALASTAAVSTTISGFDSVTFGNGEAVIYILNSAAALTLNSSLIFSAPGGQLTKAGAGTLILATSSDSTYTGRTTIWGGTLQIGTGGTSGTISNAPILDNGTLIFNRSDSAFNFSSTISGTGSFVQSGSGTTTFSGGTGSLTYAGSTTISNGTVVTTADNTLPTTTALILGNNGVGAASTEGILDITNASQTVASLSVQSDNATIANQIKVGSGKTFTVNGNVVIGSSVAAIAAPHLVMSGGGSLVVNNPATNGVFQVGNNLTNTITSGDNAVADLSGLSSVAITLNTTSGSLNIGDPIGTSQSNSNVASSLFLPTTGAGNTTITAATVIVGTIGRNNSAVVDTLKLGSGANVFNVGNFNVPGTTFSGSNTVDRDSGSVTFTNSSGTIKIRNTDGISRANLTVGGGGSNNGTGITGNNTFDVSGHYADILLNTLTVDDENRNGPLTSIFAFDTGILDATTINLAKRTGNTSTSVFTTTVNFGTSPASTGIVNVGTGGITVLNQQSTVAGQVDNSTLNLLGGTITLGGDIVEIAVASAAAHTATLNLDGATLDMGGHKIGGSVSANNVDVVTFASGTLKNVGEINNGGALTKTTNGTLVIAGTNIYSGNTLVAAGTLVVSGSISGTASAAVGDGTNPATLSGTGTIAVANATSGSVIVANAATLAPGASTNGLTINGVSNPVSVDLQSGSTFQLSIANSHSGTGGAPALSDYSKLTLGAGVTLSIEGSISTSISGTVNPGDLFTIILSGTAVSGTLFSNATLVSGTTYSFTSGGQAWEINYGYNGSLTGSGISATAFQNITGGTQVALLAVPEPGSLSMLMGGLGCLVGLQRFRRRR